MSAEDAVSIEALRSRQLVELSEEALRQRSAMIACVRVASHDIRSSLSGLLGMASLLEAGADDSPTGDKIRERARLIHNAGDKLVKVADDMIERAKSNAADEQVIQITPQELLDRISNAMAGVPFTPTFGSAEEGSSVSEPGLVIDADRLVPIVVDLVLAFPPGTSPEVAFSVADDARSASLTITGVGVAGLSPVADYLAATFGSEVKREMSADRASTICSVGLDLKSA